VPNQQLSRCLVATVGAYRPAVLCTELWSICAHDVTCIWRIAAAATTWQCLIVFIYYGYYFTLLAGRQEEHPACND